jgi:hypothetical protein
MCVYDSAISAAVVVDVAPRFSMPFVGRDGAAYVTVATLIQGCTPAASTQHNQLSLLRITKEGTIASTVIRDEPTGIVFPGEVAPDGEGGVLARGHVGLYNPTLGDYEYELVTLHSTPSGNSEWPSSTWIGEVSLAGGGSVFSRVGDQVTAQDASSGALKWTVPTAPSESVLQVQAGGGLALYDSELALLTSVDSNGVRGASQQLPSQGFWPHRAELDELSGMMLLGTEEPYTAVSKVTTEPSTDHTTFPSVTGANAEQRRGRVGIYVKGHTAVHELGIDIGPFRHSSLRITPRNQELWAPVLSVLQSLDGSARGATPDGYGNLFLTLGAGPVGGDTALSCSGTLTADPNRLSDRTRKADDLRSVLYQTEEFEDAVVQSLIGLGTYFSQNSNVFEYECFPDSQSVGYNSNSFVAGLLDAAQLPKPPMSTFRYPGWSKPVPQVRYGVTP